MNCNIWIIAYATVKNFLQIKLEFAECSNICGEPKITEPIYDLRSVCIDFAMPFALLSHCHLPQVKCSDSNPFPVRLSRKYGHYRVIKKQGVSLSSAKQKYLSSYL